MNLLKPAIGLAVLLLVSSTVVGQEPLPAEPLPPEPPSGGAPQRPSSVAPSDDEPYYVPPKPNPFEAEAPPAGADPMNGAPSTNGAPQANGADSPDGTDAAEDTDLLDEERTVRIFALPRLPDGCPRLYATAEALVLDADLQGPNRALVLDVNLPRGNDALLTTDGLDFGFKPGVRTTFGFQLTPRRAIEFSYLGGFDWGASATVTGNNNLAIPGDLGVSSNQFFMADEMRVDYSAELNGVEINWVKCRRRLLFGTDYETQCLVGFRHLGWHERFHLRSTDFQDAGSGDYAIRTNNDLFGAQVGARVRHPGRLGWIASGKVGVFGNAAEQTQSVTDFLLTLRSPRTSHARNAAFVADLGILLRWELSRVWSVQGGYNLLWIEGLALSRDQLDFTLPGGTGVDNGGGAFLHGASVGLAARW
jgi:hypothetical protein